MCQVQCKVLDIQEKKEEEEHNFVFHYFKTLESRKKKCKLREAKYFAIDALWSEEKAVPGAVTVSLTAGGSPLDSDYPIGQENGERMGSKSSDKGQGQRF